MRLLAWCLTVALAGAAGAPAVHAAQPYTPRDDAEVLLRTDAASGRKGVERGLHQALQRNPRDERAALTLSRLLLERARREGDARLAGRALAALNGWPSAQAAPTPIALQWATVQQHLHAFEPAAAVLEELTRREPHDAQAWLTLATVRRVQGHLDASQQACVGLARARAPTLYAHACEAENLGLRGPVQAARERLEALVAAADTRADQRSWIMSTLADLEVRQGRRSRAEQWLRQALALTPDDGGARVALADVLLDGNRPAEALVALAKLPATDGVLVRRAIAQAQVSPRAPNPHAQAYRDRLAQARERDSAAGSAAAGLADAAGHAREQAMFVLALDGDATRAVELARVNVDLQQEPMDLLLLARAARAAHDEQALDRARSLKRRMGLQDHRLDALL